ncbi:MAG: hypothetical protein J0M10_10565 [Chitinophagales bacterium]|nr:hypothetical protein [Chitinophagales bacterium]
MKEKINKALKEEVQRIRRAVEKMFPAKQQRPGFALQPLRQPTRFPNKNC